MNATPVWMAVVLACDEVFEMRVAWTAGHGDKWLLWQGRRSTLVWTRRQSMASLEEKVTWPGQRSCCAHGNERHRLNGEGAGASASGGGVAVAEMQTEVGRALWCRGLSW
jgi:hypothetical protein